MRLLLVEDEEKLAQLVKRALLSERFSVDVSHDGRGGLELANTFDYDLIIDLSLPEIEASTEQPILLTCMSVTFEQAA